MGIRKRNLHGPYDLTYIAGFLLNTILTLFYNESGTNAPYFEINSYLASLLLRESPFLLFR